jgi:hypothetical protein
MVGLTINPVRAYVVVARGRMEKEEDAGVP